MARIDRVVVAGYPHHVTQRGNRRQVTFASYVMDEKYLLAAVRYIELNPVRARITDDPIKYSWSSAGAHVRGRDDGFVAVKPLLDLVGDWKGFLSGGLTGDEYKDLRKHERTGRPLGSIRCLAKLETKLGEILAPQRGDRPRKQKN